MHTILYIMDIYIRIYTHIYYVCVFKCVCVYVCVSKERSWDRGLLFSPGCHILMLLTTKLFKVPS